MASYKGIEFAKGYNRPFADFKQEFEKCQVFRNMHPKERSKELKKAHKIATTPDKEEIVNNESVKEIEVKK